MKLMINSTLIPVITYPDQLVREFIESIKLDKVGWEDWPTDSRNAFFKLKALLPDCRVCRHFSGGRCNVWIEGTQREPVKCVRGDKFEERPATILWKHQ
jgi:hypothetical protein